MYVWQIKYISIHCFKDNSLAFFMLYCSFEVWQERQQTQSAAERPQSSRYVHLSSELPGRPAYMCLFAYPRTGSQDQSLAGDTTVEPCFLHSQPMFTGFTHSTAMETEDKWPRYRFSDYFLQHNRKLERETWGKQQLLCPVRLLWHRLQRGENGFVSCLQGQAQAMKPLLRLRCENKSG